MINLAELDRPVMIGDILHRRPCNTTFYVSAIVHENIIVSKTKPICACLQQHDTSEEILQDSTNEPMCKCFKIIYPNCMFLYTHLSEEELLQFKLGMDIK